MEISKISIQNSSLNNPDNKALQKVVWKKKSEHQRLLNKANNMDVKLENCTLHNFCNDTSLSQMGRLLKTRKMPPVWCFLSCCLAGLFNGVFFSRGYLWHPSIFYILWPEVQWRFWWWQVILDFVPWLDVVARSIFLGGMTDFKAF